MIAGAMGDIVLVRDQQPPRAELTAELKADGAFVLADLSRVFGVPDDGGRRGLAANYPLDVGPDSPGRVFDKVLRYRASAWDLVGRANYALSRRGYHTKLTVIHSGEGTFGDAGKASGLRFSITSGDLTRPGEGNFRLSGYLPDGQRTVRPRSRNQLGGAGSPHLPADLFPW
jgi:hypothetical protein